MSGDINVKIVPQSVAARRLEIIYRLAMALYGIVVAWEVAKVLCPPLKVQQDIMKERLRQRFPKPRKLSQEQANAFVAEVTQYVRSHEDG